MLACCAGAAAKAPTQRAARRYQHRMWCLGLRLDAHVVLIPRRRPRRRRRRRRKLLVLDTVVARRCRVRLCVPRGGARHRARRCTQVRCRRRLLNAPCPAIVAFPPVAFTLPAQAASHRCRPGCGVCRRLRPDVQLCVLVCGWLVKTYRNTSLELGGKRQEPKKPRVLRRELNAQVARRYAAGLNSVTCRVGFFYSLSG